MNRTGTALRFLSMILIVSFVLGACSSDDDSGADTIPTAEATDATASPVGDDETQVVEEAVDAVLDAIREQDRDRLRDFTGDQLRQRFQDRDFDRLTACTPPETSIEVLSRTVSIEIDSSTW